MTGFDRLRPRTADAPPLTSVDFGVPHDTAGRRALFSASDADTSAAFGSLVLTCSQCGEQSVLTPRQALRHAIPSVHLPGVKRGFPSWMRCPACERRTWVRLSLTL